MMSKRSQAMLALTVATGPLLIATTAHAATTCGQPAKAAVYETVHHDAEEVVLGEQKVVDEPAHPAVPATFTQESYEISPAVEAVPEVTSTETAWTLSNSVAPEGEGWGLTGQTRSQDAVTAVRSEWTKVTQTTEYEWVLKVVDQAAGTTVVHHDAVYRTDTIAATYKDVLVPTTYKDVVVPATYKDVVDVPEHTVHHDAVYNENLFAYVTKQGKVRYETLAWNVEDEHDNGWTLVTPYQHPLVTAAWDETVPATYTTVVDVPEHTITVVDVPEHTDTVVDVPEHTVEVLVTAAWDETVEVPEASHYERQWTDSATDAPGQGWERSTADPRVTTSSDTVFTDGDEQAPEGYSLVGQEVSTVTPGYTEYEWARTVVVTPGQPAVPAVMGERTVLVTPEVPATDEVFHMEYIVVTIPATDETKLVSEAVAATAACAADTGSPASPADTSRAASAVPTRLAFTGADPQNYLAGGLVLVFLGAGLIVAARRRQDASD